MTMRPPPVLFRVGDLAEIRGTVPPLLTIVVGVHAGRVRVAFRNVAGQPVRRWMAPGELVQVTAQYAERGVPEDLQALRART